MAFSVAVFFAVFAVVASPSWADNCASVFLGKRPSLRECRVVSGTPKNNFYHFRDHLSAGASPECLPPVEMNSVKCYKWILGDFCAPSPSSRLFLRDRTATINDQSIVTATVDSVSFHSPNFYSKRKMRYYKSMLCVYNISVDDCDNSTVTVRSTLDDHSLFDDGRDYLYFDFGLVTTTVRGDAIGTFSETVSVTSFTAVLVSDATPKTDLGRFEIEAVCNKNKKLDDIYDIY